MIIFFGSSGKYQQAALRTARRVAVGGIEVRGWWESTVFPVGPTTIEAIEKVPRIADSALLFLTPDDELIQRGQHSLAARDNVIFEAGFFMSRFGRRRTAIARVGNVNIPTDLLGITYISLREGDSDEVIAENSRLIRDWACSLHSLPAAEHLRQMADTALTRFEGVHRGASQLRAPDENHPLVFPLTAYPYFLHDLLNEETLKLTAVEAVGGRQVASFRAMQAYAECGLQLFDHRSSHWYLWKFFPPNPQVIDAEKEGILKKTASNPEITRYMCVPPPEDLPDQLFRAIYFYAERFNRSQPKAKLYFILDHDSANNNPNQMYLFIRDKWFVAERTSDDRGRSMVEVRKMDSEPGDAFDERLLCDAHSFADRYRVRYHG
jgi:hypothetical protein